MTQACELVQRLRALQVGESVLIEGGDSRTASQRVSTAKVGHRDKFFETRTLSVGVRIRRLE